MTDRRREYYAAIPGIEASFEDDARAEAKETLYASLSDHEVTLIGSDVFRTHDSAAALLKFACELDTVVDVETTAVENGFVNVEFATRRSSALRVLERYR